MTIELRLARNLLLLILLMSITFPTALQAIKITFLLLSILLFFIAQLRQPKNKYYWVGTVIIGLAFSLIGLAWSLYGLILNNPGALHVITVMVVYPLLMLFFAPVFRPGDLVRIQGVMYVASIILVGTQIIFLLSLLGLDGGVIFSLANDMYGDIAVISDSEEALSFALPSVASLIFFIPYLFFNFLLEKKINYIKLTLLLVMVLLAFMAGRRAIYLSFILSASIVIIIVLFSIKEKKVEYKNFIRKIYIILFLVGGVILLASLMGIITFDFIYQNISSIFDFKQDLSNALRYLQFNALIDGFQENPILGAGAGAAASFSRSYEHPWAYELYYLAILFQYGLLGILPFVLGIIYLLFSMGALAIKVVSNNLKFTSLISFLSGFIAFLIATATNPYLGKFDYMWIIFIPLSIINCKKIFGSV